jgi:MFS family permease
MGAWRWVLPGRAADAPAVGLVIGGGAAWMVAAAFVSAAVPATAPGGRLAVLAVALAGFAALTVDLVAVAAVAGLAALVCNGFLVNQLGVLSWHGTADAVRLAVLAAAAAVGLAAGAGHRFVRRARLWRARHRQVSQWIAEATVEMESASPGLVRRFRTAAGGRERRDG